MTELERINQKIKEQEEVVKDAEELNYHKDYFGKGSWNELARLRVEKELILTGVEWSHHNEGMVIVENKYFYALKSGKWRVKGKQEWHTSKSLKHFIENTVREES